VVRHKKVRLVIAESRQLIGVPVKGGPGSQIKVRTGILTGRSPGMITSSRPGCVGRPVARTAQRRSGA
jgi:hypothetical protein